MHELDFEYVTMLWVTVNGVNVKDILNGLTLMRCAAKDDNLAQCNSAVFAYFLRS